MDVVRSSGVDVKVQTDTLVPILSSNSYEAVIRQTRQLRDEECVHEVGVVVGIDHATSSSGIHIRLHVPHAVIGLLSRQVLCTNRTGHQFKQNILTFVVNEIIFKYSSCRRSNHQTDKKT